MVSALTPPFDHAVVYMHGYIHLIATPFSRDEYEKWSVLGSGQKTLRRRATSLKIDVAK